MKPRTLILTIAAAVALVVPATHAANGANTLQCALPTKPTIAHIGPKPFFSPLNPRGLQSIASSRLGSSYAANKAVTTTAPNRFQVLRNAL